MSIARSSSITPVKVPVRSWLSWRNKRSHGFVLQLVAVVVVCAIVVTITMQTAANLKARGIASGFDYLTRPAGFEIARSPVPYSSHDTYARALELGVVNTLRVAMLGILIATPLGLLIGIARLSNIWVLSTLSRAYVEVLRNTPLLLQLFFWYSLSQVLPGPHDALQPLPNVFLCSRGLYLPTVAWPAGYLWLTGALFSLAIFVVLTFVYPRYLQERKGVSMPAAPLVISAAALLLLAVIAFGRQAIAVDRPALAGFDFRGGLSISPEFAALLIGLSTYSAAFIGEIVRGGILAVAKGQKEAAAALGLSRFRVLRLVVLPQALRVIVPPTTSQFLSLAKNSSLAVAIGYPDLISVTDTTLNQTGQAIEAITVAMIVYLAISLTISMAMNVYNRRAAMRGTGVTKS